MKLVREAGCWIHPLFTSWQFHHHQSSKQWCPENCRQYNRGNLQTPIHDFQFAVSVGRDRDDSKQRDRRPTIQYNTAIYIYCANNKHSLSCQTVSFSSLFYLGLGFLGVTFVVQLLLWCHLNSISSLRALQTSFEAVSTWNLHPTGALYSCTADWCRT